MCNMARWPLLADGGPGFAVVGAAEQGAGVGAGVDPCGVQPIGGHRLAQHAEERVFLRQALAHCLPFGAAVAGAVNGGFAVRHIAAGGVAVQR